MNCIAERPKHNLYMTENFTDKLHFRWLGTAGIEIHYQKKVLLIDPYLTRVPIRKFVFSKIEANTSLIKDLIPKADNILITHSHFDHLSDVPTIMSYTDSIAAGSLNTLKILKAAGVSDERFIEIDSKKTIDWSFTNVSSNPISHMRIPGYGSGEIKRIDSYPMKSSAYKMDVDYQYQINIGDFVFLTDIGKTNTIKAKCDVLFLFPFYSKKYIHEVLQRIETKNIMFLHWDNFMKPFNYKDGTISLPNDDLISCKRKSYMLSMSDSIKKTVSDKINVVIPKLNEWYGLNTDSAITAL